MSPGLAAPLEHLTQQVPPSPNTSERLRSRRCTFAGDDGDSSFEDYLAEYAAELPPEAGVVKQRRRSSATGEAYPRRYTISNGFALAPSSQLETVKACLSAEITDPPTASPRLARSLSQRRNAKRAAERRVSFSGVGSPAEDLPVSSAVFEDADDTPSVLAMQGGLSPRLTSSKSLTLRGRRATVGVCPPISPPRKPGAQAFRGPSSTVFDDVEDWEFGTLRSDAAHLLAQSPMVYAQSSHHQSSSGAPIQDSQTSMPEPLLLPEAAGNTGGSKSTPRGRRATINGELHHVVERLRRQMRDNATEMEPWPAVWMQRRQQSPAGSFSSSGAVEQTRDTCSCARKSLDIARPTFDEVDEDGSVASMSTKFGRCRSMGAATGTLLTRATLARSSYWQPESDNSESGSPQTWNDSSIADTPSPCGSASPRGFFHCASEGYPALSNESPQLQDAKALLASVKNDSVPECSTSPQPGFVSPAVLVANTQPSEDMATSQTMSPRYNLQTINEAA